MSVMASNMDPKEQLERESLYPHVVRLVRETPWAILPATLEAIVEVVRLRASGERFSDEEIEQRVGARRLSTRDASGIKGAVAVLPLYGVLAQRMNMLARTSGGTSTEQFAAALRAAVDSPDVAAVVVDIDSPGGSVFGVEEAADVIVEARQAGKPIVAIANALSASAAYWLGSQADEFVVTPSGEVGSIGVLAVHQDLTGAAAQAGVKVTYLSAGRYKTEGAPFEPLTDEARAAMQVRLDAYYGSFVKAVARGRGVSPREVREGFGQGRVVGAAQAVRLGMADRIGTLEDAIARAGQLSAGSGLAPRRRRGARLAARAVGGSEAAGATMGGTEFRLRRLRANLRAAGDASEWLDPMIARRVAARDSAPVPGRVAMAPEAAADMARRRARLERLAGKPVLPARGNAEPAPGYPNLERLARDPALPAAERADLARRLARQVRRDRELATSDAEEAPRFPNLERVAADPALPAADRADLARRLARLAWNWREPGSR